MKNEMEDEDQDLDKTIMGDEFIHDFRSDEIVTIAGPDPMQRMEARTATLTAENREQELRIKKLEDKVVLLLTMFPDEKERSRIKPHSTDLFGPTDPSTQSNMSSDWGSKSTTSEYVNDFDISSYNDVKGANLVPQNSVSNSTTLTTNIGGYRLASATSAMGYTNKKQAWGTAFASIIVGMMKYYITKTGKTNI